MKKLKFIGIPIILGAILLSLALLLLLSAKASDPPYWPIAGMFSYILPESGYQTESRPDHLGVDIAGIPNSGVIAYQKGIVVYTFDGCGHVDDWNPIYGKQECKCAGGGYERYLFTRFGNCVLISHDGGTYFTLYAHLKQGTLTARIGQSVAAGQRLGAIGSSGKSTSPHLHFAISEKATFTPIDPTDYLKSTARLISPIALD